MPLLMPSWYASLLLWFFLLFGILATWMKSVVLPHQVAQQWVRSVLVMF